MASVSRRGGIPTSQSLPNDLRSVIEPMLDLLRRITGAYGGIAKLQRPDFTPIQPLAGAATLADTINKVNELNTRVAAIADLMDVVIFKQQEIIDRLEKD
jgi:hypothetical protein